MTLFDNLITAGVLISLAVIGYCKYTNQTVGQLIRDIMDAFKDNTENIQGGALP